MTSDEIERAAMARFKRERELAMAPVRLDIERRVCGSDYGATSWTTVDEARRVADRLALAPGMRLLDIGAGAGWPGLYLAGLTGCDVVLTDIPFFGLRSAMERAGADGMAGKQWAAVADGAQLPFRTGAFDAVSHSDVLCCLSLKRAALESSRRVVRAGGRTVFTVISIPPGLSSTDHARALAAGPPFIDAEEAYPAVIEETGWEITDHLDLTGAFLESSRRMLDEEETHADELGRLHGAEDFAARLNKRRSRVDILGEGLLRRELFAATAI